MGLSSSVTRGVRAEKQLRSSEGLRLSWLVAGRKHKSASPAGSATLSPALLGRAALVQSFVAIAAVRAFLLASVL